MIREKFDMLDLDIFKDGHPHHLYNEMRAENRVFSHKPMPDRPPLWLVNGYKEIQQVVTDNDNFSSAQGFRIPTANRASMHPKILETVSRFMLAMDDPEHAEFRKLVAKSFGPTAIKSMTDVISHAASNLVENLKGRNEFEFVSEIGLIVPIRTICTILGVPLEDEWRIFDFTNAVFGTDDPEYAPSQELANQRYLEIFDYGEWLLEERRREPKDDLISLIAHGTLSNGRPLQKIEQISYFSNMIAAGNETTRSSLSAGMWALHLFRDQRREILNDPSLLQNAVQEILRWHSPVLHQSRTALHDVQIGDQQIKAGDKIAMLWGAGNRDPEIFENADAFDIRRPNAVRHLAFGYGLHHCLGHRLAILQLQILLENFLKAFPDYEVTEKPQYIRSNFVCAMKRLPVRLNG